MIGGIVIGVFGIAYLLENFPPIVWAFFFGLILGSVFYIGRQINDWSWKEVAALIICTVRLQDPHHMGTYLFQGQLQYAH